MARKKPDKGKVDLGRALLTAIRARDSDPDAVEIIQGIAIAAIRREKRQKQSASKQPRGGGKLPAQAALLAEWEALTAKNKTPREANSVLYARYPDVQPKAIRDKLKRARLNKSGT